MAALILPSRRVVQPQGALAANISSPLARDMRFLWAHGSDRDLVKGAPYAIAGTAPADTSTPKGFAKVGAGSGNLNFGLRTDLGTPGTNQLSVMAVAYIDDSAAATGAFMGRVNSAFCFTLGVNSGSQQFTFGINQSITVVVPEASVIAGLLPVNKRPVVIVGTYNGATADLYVETFGDSAFKGSNSRARTGNFPSNPSDPFSLLSRGGTGERLNGASMIAGGVWGRALHRNEVDAILENPWQLFKPIERRIWVGAAGGGPVTLVTSDASHAQTAGNLTLATTTATGLTVAASAHAQTAESLTLTAATALTVASAAHAQTAEALTLTAATGLSLASAAHAQTADNLALITTGATSLTVADASHAQTAGSIALTSSSFLVTADAIHGQTADLLTLSTASFFAVDGATHAQTAENLSITIGEITLDVSDALHAQIANNLNLTGVAPPLDAGGFHLPTVRRRRR